MSLKRISFASLSVLALALGLAGTPFSSVLAVDSVKAPRPIPLTRPEMKEYLEDMKGRTLRIPLPELTDEDKEQLLVANTKEFHPGSSVPSARRLCGEFAEANLGSHCGEPVGLSRC